MSLKGGLCICLHRLFCCLCLCSIRICSDVQCTLQVMHSRPLMYHRDFRVWSFRPTAVSSHFASSSSASAAVTNPAVGASSSAMMAVPAQYSTDLIMPSEVALVFQHTDVARSVASSSSSSSCSSSSFSSSSSVVVAAAAGVDEKDEVVPNEYFQSAAVASDSASAASGPVDLFRAPFLDACDDVLTDWVDPLTIVAKYHPGVIGARPNGIGRLRKDESIMWQSDSQHSGKGYTWKNFREGWEIRSGSLEKELEKIYGIVKFSRAVWMYPC
jgi:hypothetical protein